MSFGRGSEGRTFHVVINVLGGLMLFLAVLALAMVFGIPLIRS